MSSYQYGPPTQYGQRKKKTPRVNTSTYPAFQPDVARAAQEPPPRSTNGGALNAIKNFLLSSSVPSAATIRGIAGQQNRAARSSGRGGGGSFGPDYSYLDDLDRMRNSGYARGAGRQQVEPDPTLTLFDRTLSDYLNGINGDQFSAEALAEIDARERMLRGQAGTNDAQLAKIYSWLVQQIQGQDPQINRQYEQAQGQTRANMQAATNAAVQGGQSSNEELARTFANLGLQPGNGSGNLAAGRGAAINDMARLGQINADYLANSGVTQRNLNRENATAAGYRGAEERAALQQELMRILGELETSRAEARASGQSQAMDMARMLYEADRDAAYKQFDAQRSMDNEAWNREVESQRLGLARQEAARRAEPDEQELSAFDSIGQRLAQTQGRSIANTILETISGVARQGSQTPADFANRVYNELSRRGLPPSALMEGQAAAEQYWRAYRK